MKNWLINIPPSVLKPIRTVFKEVKYIYIYTVGGGYPCPKIVTKPRFKIQVYCPFINWLIIIPPSVPKPIKTFFQGGQIVRVKMLKGGGGGENSLIPPLARLTPSCQELQLQFDLCNLAGDTCDRTWLAI